MPSFIKACLVGACMGLSSLNAAEQIRIGSGNISGVYYPTIQGICQLSQDKGGQACEVRSGKGSLENLQGVLNGSLDFAVMQSDIVYQHYDEANEKTKTLRTVMAIYPELLALIVHKDSGIEVLHDIESKHISLGGEGSGTAVTATRLLEEADIQLNSFSAENLDADKALEALNAKQIDGYFYMVGHPAKNITLAAEKGINLLIIDGKPVYNLLDKYPYYSKGEIPANIYAGVDEDVPSIGVKAVLVTSANTADEKVQHLLAVLLENFDQFKQYYPTGSLANIADLVNDVSGAPLHPAAQAYYKQQGLLD